MKSLQFHAAVALAMLVSSGAAANAQLLAAKEGPVAMGHYHLNVSDVAAHRRFWGDLLGGEATSFGKTAVYKFPNALVFLRAKAPTAGSIGSGVNHIGFQVPSVKQLLPKLKKAGVPVVTQREVTGGRAKSDIFHSPSQDIDLAFVMGPDDIKVELLENSALDSPIANHHIHFAHPDVKAAQKWYVEAFGAEPMVRGPFQAADLPGVNLTFSPRTIRRRRRAGCWTTSASRSTTSKRSVRSSRPAAWGSTCPTAILRRWGWRSPSLRTLGASTSS